MGGHEFSLETEPAPVLAVGAWSNRRVASSLTTPSSTPVGGRIRIVVSCREDKVMFTVQDSGIGIAPEDIPHIFDRFYRADDSRARATGGTGLGLSIAKWVAERHGGYLEVFSRENFGTRISLVLPRSESAKSRHRRWGRGTLPCPGLWWWCRLESRLLSLHLSGG